MWRSFWCAGLAVLVGGPAVGLLGAETFFDNEVLVRGRGVEVRRAELDHAFLQFKANATLRNQEIPESRREELEAMLLDRLLVTRLLLGRATEVDRKEGKAQSDEFVAKVMREAGSDAGFQRQLLALGFSREDFESQVLERAVCEAVVERELLGAAAIPDQEVQAFYEANREKMQRPEMVRASHILISTRDLKTGKDLSDAEKAEKRLLAEKVLKRVQANEDFVVLVKEFSDDPGSKDQGGEYIFPRGQMVPEFEAAAFTLEEGKVSDVVTTQFGYHIIKLLQRIPPETIAFEKVKEEIREQLQQTAVQERLLPAHIEKLKASAELVYTNGARPPSPAAPAPPAQQ